MEHVEISLEKYHDYQKLKEHYREKKGMPFYRVYDKYYTSNHFPIRSLSEEMQYFDLDKFTEELLEENTKLKEKDKKDYNTESKLEHLRKKCRDLEVELSEAKKPWYKKLFKK